MRISTIIIISLLLSCNSVRDTVVTASKDTANAVKDIITEDIIPTREPANIIFLIADDWSYPHASAYGDKVVRTPSFDWIAENGALFHNAYCASPSCTPSRGSILSGRYPHENGPAGNLWSVIPDDMPNYVRILNNNGYFTGMTRKGWAPGDFSRGTYTHNPAGKSFKDFKEFYQAKRKNQPFAYWFGSSDPHRAFETNSGITSGMAIEDVQVPAFFPDTDCIRNDLLDYYYEVERFDRECGQIIAQLKAYGELENTLIIMTSDNGMPFPRAKANLYDYGTRMPLAIYWADEIEKGQVVNEFTSSTDIAPTFLEAAQVEAKEQMSGSSLIPLLTGNSDFQKRDYVVVERERHANVRKGDLSYPMRSLRSNEFLYIKNFMPDRWPAGDPDAHISVGQFGDVDNSITKYTIMNMKDRDSYGGVDYFNITFGKRPTEELYDVKKDPYNIINLAGNVEYQTTLIRKRTQLQDWMRQHNDIRASEPQTNYWDTVEYTPKYDYDNFDLVEKMYAYEKKIPSVGGTSRKTINCFDEYPTTGSIERIDPALDEWLPKGIAIEVLAEGHVWTEGPVWVPELNGLLYSDIPPNEIHLWREGERSRLYLKPSGYTSDVKRGGEVGSNGLLLDNEGNLVLCQHGNRQIARMTSSFFDPKPNYESIASLWEGKRFNSPNDAVFNSNGDVYFTDPPYGLEKNMSDPNKEIDFQGIYKSSPSGQVSLLSKSMSRPNGIAFSPDEKILYVANSDGRKAIWNAYDVLDDGSLTNERVFFDVTAEMGKLPGAPDGLKVDKEGNLWATGPGGVWIIDAQGKVLGRILTGYATSNCAFGGENMDELYMTADYYLMRVKLKQSAI